MEPHLHSLFIKRFRGLRDIAFPDLGAFNILVGQNNSGKTSVLEALMLILRPGDSRNWINLLSARDAAGGEQGRQRAVEWLYPVIPRSEPVAHSAVELECQFSIGGASLRSTLLRTSHATAETPNISIEYSAADTESRILSGGIYLGAQRTVDLITGAVKMTPGPKIDADIRSIPGTRVELAKAHGHRTSRASLLKLVHALEGPRGTNLREILQTFDDDIIGLVRPSSGTSKGQDFVEHRKLGLVPLESFGDGVRKAAYLLDRMLKTEGGLLLIDELEVAFHPAILEPLCAGLRSLADLLNIQIIATTHSLEAVDAVLRAFEPSPRALIAYRLEREPNLAVRRFDGSALHDLRHVLGQEIR